MNPVAAAAAVVAEKTAEVVAPIVLAVVSMAVLDYSRHIINGEGPIEAIKNTGSDMVGVVETCAEIGKATVDGAVNLAKAIINQITRVDDIDEDYDTKETTGRRNKDLDKNRSREDGAEAAPEDYVKNKKGKDKDQNRDNHDKKEKGAPDRSKEDVDNDY